jgi:hypothetical protein
MRVAMMMSRATLMLATGAAALAATSGHCCGNRNANNPYDGRRRAHVFNDRDRLRRRTPPRFASTTSDVTISDATAAFLELTRTSHGTFLSRVRSRGERNEDNL